MDYGFRSPKLFLDHAKEILNKCLLISVCLLYLKDSEICYIYLFYATIPLIAGEVFFLLLSIFNVLWAFDRYLSSNVFQLLSGPLLPKGPRLIWANMSKALLAEIWYEFNHTYLTTRQGDGLILWTRQRGMLQLGVL